MILPSRAQELTTLLVERQMELVYGAGNVGLMGEIADAVLAADGKVDWRDPAIIGGHES